MKNKIAILALCLVAAFTAAAQDTNQVPNLLPSIGNPTISGGIQQIYDAALGSTNFAVAVGGGRSLKGQYDIVFADYVYKFNENVGALLGFDDIAENGNFTTDEIVFVKGGLSVKADIYPLKNWGLKDFHVTPFGALLMSSGNGRVGQIEVAGVNYHIGIAKGWYFNLGGFYENRSGDGLPTDGAYLCGHLAISKGF